MGQKTTQKVVVPPPTAAEQRLQGIAGQLGEEQLRAIQSYSPYREQLFGLLPSLAGGISRDLGLTPSVPLRGTTQEEQAYREFLNTAPAGVNIPAITGDETYQKYLEHPGSKMFGPELTAAVNPGNFLLPGSGTFAQLRGKRKDKAARTAQAAAQAAAIQQQQQEAEQWTMKAFELRKAADEAKAAAPTFGPTGNAPAGTYGGGDGDSLALDAYALGFSPYEEAIVNQVASSQYALGSSDIQAAYRESLGDLAQELAPARGLRGYDAPILDRGGKLATEAVRQRSQLSLGLRAKSGEQLLGLTQQAKQNRLGLLQFLGNQGLGLGTGDALGASRSMQDARLGQAGRSSGTSGLGTQDYASIAAGVGSLVSAFSSRELKDVGTQVSGRGILKKLRELKIHRWTYKGDATPHLGPMAEDFKQLFGVGDGKTLALVDVMGVLLGAMQGLAEEVANG